MKALILAAGLGTRLRPLTETVPKPLLDIQGKPHLSYVLKSVQNAGIYQFLINTHYLADQVVIFAKAYEQENPGVSITTVYEETLIGSAGTLRENAGFFSGDEDVFIIYADVLTSADLADMIKTHQESDAVVTILCTEEDDVREKGVIECDNAGVITAFYEKPAPGVTASKNVNGGIYVMRADGLPLIQEMSADPLDFGHNVFPDLLRQGKKMLVYKTKDFVLDIGSHTNYQKAQTLDLTKIL